MERKKPVSGEFYQHFSGKLYQIKMLAKDSGTEKEMVVYQAMYAPYTCWVRDLEEFMSTVDREKYPEVAQEYRFQQVSLTPEGKNRQETSLQRTAFVKPARVFPADASDEAGQGEAVCEASEEAVCSVSDEDLLKALKTGQPERYLEHKMTEEEIAGRGLMQLLDADTFHEKRQILIGLKQYLDKHMLSNIAVALDIVLEEGDVETQYESVMRCMETFERYEGGRLR